jgi:hypothetical protein
MNIRRMQRSVRPKVQMKSQEARASRRGGHARVAFLAAMYQRPSRGENIETFSCTRSYGEEEKEGAGVPLRDTSLPLFLTFRTRSCSSARLRNYERDNNADRRLAMTINYYTIYIYIYIYI